MFRKLLSSLQGPRINIRTAEKIDLSVRLRGQLENKIFYTPRVQKLSFSEELKMYMSYLQRKKEVSPSDLKQMVENILIDYGCIYHQHNQQVQYGFIRDFEVRSNSSNRYFGQVDWLVYTDQTHFFPMMFFQDELNEYAGAAMAYSNMVTKCQLSSKHHINRSVRKEIEGISLITNGNQWQLFKCTENIDLQKSVIFEPADTSSNPYRLIYKDDDMIQVGLGLVHSCLSLNDQQLLALQKAYQYIDDQKYMKVDQSGKMSVASKVLLKLYSRDNNKK